MTEQPSTSRPPASPVREVGLLFLKLGAIGFGGPAGHIALMRQELVARRKWLSDQQFVDLLSVTNLLPGPNSTEMAVHIGFLRAGWRGLVVAGVAFILPAAVLVTALAWLYVEHGSLPEVEGLLRGVKPVLIVIVLQALWGLGRAVLRRSDAIALAGASAVLNAFGVHELAVLFGAGAILAGWRAVQPSPRFALCPLAAAIPAFLLAASEAAAAVTLGRLFWLFARIGAVLFGSGYVLLAFLRAEFVERLGWLTETQLLDAVAVGQATPGPLFTAATFIGYLLAGIPGALAATAGIFLPAFLFVAASGPIVARVRRSPAASAFLDGVNAASLALMAVVTWHLGLAAILDVPTAAIALLAAAASLWLRVHATWLVLAGALAGLLLGRAG